MVNLMKKILFLLLLLFIFPLSVFSYDFNINSNNVILINLNENKILYEKNSDSKTYIASLTKIMTAVVALENIDDLNNQILILENQNEELGSYIKQQGYYPLILKGNEKEFYKGEQRDLLLYLLKEELKNNHNQKQNHCNCRCIAHLHTNCTVVI